MTASLPMPVHRTFVLIIALALAFGVLVPLATPASTAAVSPDVVISQVYGGGGNSGSTLTNDFIELYNRGASAVDLNSWSVQYASAAGTSWQTTSLVGSIAPGSYYLIQQAAGMAGTTPLPTPNASGAIPMSATAGKVALLTSQTVLVGCGSAAAPCRSNPAIRDFVGYGSTATEFEGSSPTPTLSNTTAAIRSDEGATDTDTNGTDFVVGSPNPRNSGSGEPEAVQIWEIQGMAHRSPLVGTTVADVEGVVTAVSGNGFWMTDATPDADPFTSDGLFVFRGSGAKPAVGSEVQVDGPVAEFRPGGGGGFENLTITQITTPNTFSVVSTGNVLPVTVIGEGGRMPPAEIIDDDTAGGDGTIDGAGAVTRYDPATDGIDFYESLEGMYVQVSDAVAVGPTAFFGSVSREIAVVSGAPAGARTQRGGIIVRQLGVDGDYRAGDFNPERLILANTLASLPEVNVGDGFASDPVGVIDYTFGNFKLFVTSDPGRDDNGLTREVTDATGAQELAVATYNVENLTVGNPQAKFDELAGQIINNLRAPDLIVIEEMQDDSGATNNGVVTAQLGWERLIAAVVAAGGPAYEFRSIDPVNNADGGAPGSNIRVGFLFTTDRGLEFVDRPGGTATADTGVMATPNGKGAQLTISPGRVLPDPAGQFATAFVDTRKSLAGEFRWRGETLFVVANHFSSKGDDHPLFGRFQPPVRFTEFQSGAPEDGWRHAQAQVINDFTDEILAVDGDAHVIVLGDINDFDFSETVGVLTGELVAATGGPDLDGSGPTLPGGAPVLGTLFDGLAADERYSYVFEGNSQVLDQILVSTSLLALDPRYDVVHMNAEFARQASDHDPSVMRVAFQPRRSG